jgi:hypothetical protein
MPGDCIDVYAIIQFVFMLAYTNILADGLWKEQTIKIELGY